MSYASDRRRAFRKLAEQFEANALKAAHPATSAKWTVLMDAALWASSADGDVDTFEKWAKEFRA